MSRRFGVGNSFAAGKFSTLKKTERAFRESPKTVPKPTVEEFQKHSVRMRDYHRFNNRRKSEGRSEVSVQEYIDRYAT